MSSKSMEYQSLKTYLEPGEVESLIQAAPTLRDKLIIRFLFRTGCRVSELCALKAANIDFKRSLILIDHLKSLPRMLCPGCEKKVGGKSRFCPYCGTELTETEPKQVRRQRLIPLDRETFKLIKEYLKKRRSNDDRLIPLTRQRVNQIVKEAAEEASLGGKILLNPESGTGKRHYVSPHRLRDAFAIYWLDAKDSPEAQKALQEQLGHMRFDTTAKYLKLDVQRIGKIYKEVFNDGD